MIVAIASDALPCTAQGQNHEAVSMEYTLQDRMQSDKKKYNHSMSAVPYTPLEH